MSALATALDPQGSLYNVRLLPLWFISVYLMAAWAFGVGCIAVAGWWRRARARRWEAAMEPVAAPAAEGELRSPRAARTAGAAPPSRPDVRRPPGGVRRP